MSKRSEDGRKEIISSHLVNGVVVIPTPSTWTVGAKSLTDVSALVISNPTVSFEDVTGDGITDIIERDLVSATKKIVLYKGQSNFSLIAPTTIFSGPALGALSFISDFDNDGVKDILFGAGQVSLGGFSYNGGVYIYNSQFQP